MGYVIAFCVGIMAGAMWMALRTREYDVALVTFTVRKHLTDKEN